MIGRGRKVGAGVALGRSRPAAAVGPLPPVARLPPVAPLPPVRRRRRSRRRCRSPRRSRLEPAPCRHQERHQSQYAHRTATRRHRCPAHTLTFQLDRRAEVPRSRAKGSEWVELDRIRLWRSPGSSRLERPQPGRQPLGLSAGRRRERELEDDARAAARLVGGVHAAAVGVGDPLDQRQPEAERSVRAGVGIGAAVEPLEHAALVARREAAPAIDDLERDARRRRRAPPAAPGRRRACARCRSGWRARARPASDRRRTGWAAAPRPAWRRPRRRVPARVARPRPRRAAWAPRPGTRSARWRGARPRARRSRSPRARSRRACADRSPALALPAPACRAISTSSRIRASGVRSSCETDARSSRSSASWRSSRAAISLKADDSTAVSSNPNPAAATRALRFPAPSSCAARVSS